MRQEQTLTKAQIEAARGNFFIPRTDSFDPAKELKPLRTLSTAEQQQVAANRAAVHKHMPELVGFIGELHAEGMIDGWRSVDAVEVNFEYRRT